MNFDFLKKISAVYFYMLSIFCLVLANVIRDINYFAYTIFLILGIGFSVFGFIKTRNKK